MWTYMHNTQAHMQRVNFQAEVSGKMCDTALCDTACLECAHIYAHAQHRVYYSGVNLQVIGKMCDTAWPNTSCRPAAAKQPALAHSVMLAKLVVRRSVQYVCCKKYMVHMVQMEHVCNTIVQLPNNLRLRSVLC